MKDLLTAIKERHAVRKYISKPISQEIGDKLSAFVEQVNKESNLHLQAIFNDSKAFTTGKAKYGKFENVENYIALVGSNTSDYSEKIGYYGEKIVLYITQLGLDSVWVGLTFGKNPERVKVEQGEKWRAVIAFGYGANHGFAHKIKQREQVMKADNAPQWFLNGIDAALLAPTAMNQQKFKFILQSDGSIKAKSGFGIMTDIDLGIAKYHFEIGAGRAIDWK